MLFPVKGKLGQSWTLDQSSIDRWQTAYPLVDVEAECLKAQSWCVANPARRKSPRGMERFLNGWMARSTGSRSVNPIKATVARLEPIYDYSWRDACITLHSGTCESYRQHDLRVTKDDMKRQGLLGQSREEAS